MPSNHLVLCLKEGGNFKYLSVFRSDQKGIKRYTYCAFSVNILIHDSKGRPRGLVQVASGQEHQNLGRHSPLVGIQRPAGTTQTQAEEGNFMLRCGQHTLTFSS